MEIHPRMETLRLHGFPLRAGMRLIVVFAPFEHDHLVGDDLNNGMFCAFFILSAAGLQAPINADLAAFVKEIFASLRQITDA